MMEHCPHITLTLGPFGQYLHEQHSYGDKFEPVFAEEHSGRHGEARGQEGETGEH